MPFISTKTNIEITKEKEASIKQKLGKAIELVPGKSEAWLMLSFEDKVNMYFNGQSDKPVAFVEVKLFGGASAGAYDKLTAAVTKILNEELDISPSQIYVKYEEVKTWGWNGSNF
jgi:phenylpyruvate tautomerase PptA (4-oxalocrotonate tautomerase family)